MKKKIDLKMLENADNKTLEELSAKYRAVDDKKAEQLFQRLMKNSDNFEEEVHVQGVEIYHKTMWRKALAAACTIVIAVGAVAGGTYYFSKLKRHSGVEDEKKSDSVYVQGDYYSIYAKLKDAQDNYSMTTIARLFNEDKITLIQENEGKNKFFSYIDSLEMNEINDEAVINDQGRFKLAYASELQKFPKSIRFSFKSDDDTSITLDIYENGHAVWSEKNMSSETTADYFITDGEKVFSDIVKLYNINVDSVSDWNDVSADELESFIDSSYYLSSNPTAYKINDGKQEEFNIDIEVFKHTILSLEWERATEFEYENYYSFCGVSMSETGYMAGTYNGCNVVYKLKDDADLDKLNTIWKSGEEAAGDMAELLDRIRNDTTVQWFEGPTYAPQGKFHYDTTTRYYTITDTNSLLDELISLEWEACTQSEIENATGHRDEGGLYISDGSYEFGSSGYFGIVSLYPKGYMSIEDNDRNYCYFKLKNESDAEKITQMAEKYFVMDESSELAEKISKGVTNFENLKAHYTYNLSCDGVVEKSISGDLSVDAKNNKMYMTGDGTWLLADEIKNVSSEIVMFGYDDSAFKVLNKDTGEEIYSGIYKYSNGYAMAPPEYHYIYFCKDIEKSLTPRFLDGYLTFNAVFESREVDGNTEITTHSKEPSNNEKTTILLTPNGQLISCEYSNDAYKISFKLDDYVFDSPDFTMADTASVYEKIKNADEVSDR